MFAELCAVARTDHPQPSVEYFLNLHQSLKNAVAVSDALSTARNSPETASDTEGNEPSNNNDKAQVVMEKSRSAASWVNAALTSDLAAFSIQSKQGPGLRSSVSKRATSQQLQVMLDNGPSTVPRGRSSSPSVTTRATLSTPSSPKARTALSSVGYIANEKRTAAESRSQSPVKPYPASVLPTFRPLLVADNLIICAGACAVKLQACECHQSYRAGQKLEI